MNQRIVSACVAASLFLVFAAVVSGQGRGKPPSPQPVPVVSVVHDVDGTAVFHLQSDLLGPYQGSGGILSQIYNESGDWELDLSGQTFRQVRLLLDPVNGGSPAGYDAYNLRLISRCFDAEGYITGYLQITEGSSNTRCALRLGFTANNVRYTMVMSPLYAGTDWATVSCPADADANNTCEQWTVAPGTGTTPAVASLYSFSKSNKEVFVGAYRMTFKIGVTR